MVLTDRIIERKDPGPCPPMTLAGPPTGFPKVEARPKVKVVESDPSSLSISRKDMAKLEWTNPVESVSEGLVGRFDFDGNLILDDPDEYRREMYHHGIEADKPGYSLAELFHLSQSGFQSQKALAIKAIGAIANSVTSRKTRREFHASLISEWKAHVRFSVACSDTSLGVREAAWSALLGLMTLDKECGCAAADLASVPELFRAFDPENANSVKVFLFITAAVDGEEFEELRQVVVDTAGEIGLDPTEFQSGVKSTRDLIQSIAKSSESSAAEMIATLSDRLACVHAEPLADDDVTFFESILAELAPTIPFFGLVDEFAWTARCSLVTQCLTESNGSAALALFAAKLAWLYTCALFPVECRAAIWGNIELLHNISKLVGETGSLALLHNHKTLDFHLQDAEVNSDNAMIFRAIKNGCNRFIQEADEDACREMLAAAKAIVSGSVGKI